MVDLSIYTTAGWEQTCRDQDLKQRKLENNRRRIDDARRSIEVKAEQLNSLSTQSALIAGFSMVVLVESDKTLPPTAGHRVLLILFGITAALVVGLMLTCMLTATFVRVGITRYNAVDRKVGGRDMTFNAFWSSQCEEDWLFAFNCFVYGVTVFIIELALVGWIVFKKKDLSLWAWIIVNTSISIIAFLVLIKFLMYTYPKWNEWLTTAEVKDDQEQLTIRQEEMQAIREEVP